MSGGDWCRAGSNGSSPLRPSGVVVDSRSVTVQWLWTTFFAPLKAEVMNRRYTILHGFADYNLLPEVEASTVWFFHTSNSFPNEKLEQLQQFVQRTFRKECAAYTATEKKILSSIMNKGDKCLDRKDC